MTMLQFRKLSPLMIAILLVGCGEGGDSASNPSSLVSGAAKQITAGAAVVNAAAAVPAGLYISEVAGNFRKDKDYDAGTSKNSVAWVELYNKQNVSVNLKDYVLRTGGLKASDPTVTSASVNYVLPNVVIPANGYVVIAGKKSNFLLNSTVNSASQVIYIKDATNTYLPYWDNASGFIELQAAKTTTTAAKTVDFVRFGSSATAPLTAGAWVGSNVPAFATPAAGYVGSQSLDPLDTHEQSIVRLTNAFAASKTSADWTQVNFPTSGGPNDVAAGVVDSDHDGIPDSAKVAGGTYAGLDLYTLGARPGQQDMFIQLDYMGNDSSVTTQDSARQLQESAITKMVNAFSPHQVAVHFDVGNLFAANIDASHYNLDGLSHQRAFNKCAQMTNTTDYQRTSVDAGCTSLYQYYTQNVDPRRRAFFRYGMIASSQQSNGKAGSSGVSELPGNKVLVTLGGFLANNLSAAGKLMRINWQAATLMHEFGHSLSLMHGGDELAVNFKPNYLSIMNYLYQLSGVPTNFTGDDAIERYYSRQNWYNGVEVPNNSVPGTTYAAYTYSQSLIPHGPATNDFVIDYSSGTSANLDESALSEADYVGHGAGTDANAYGDWNMDAVKQNATYSYSLTGRTDDFGNPYYGVIHDFNDWGHLALVTGKDYSGSVSGSLGVSLKSAVGKNRPKPVVKTSQIQREDVLPPQVLANMKAISAQ
ncbi:hypothetical protein [Aquirhabdus parva]|uniref:LTD domain-containing protein n=1 Tax=Aquirhabdus parva TaxID=2283318 RepID=A0A345P9G9_9GAMM|nr:hypothetical protein [Aquirhabdus parva]AXI03928.1 hypothetical protein HYN46_14430 [Aquirhabdus parva]